MPTSSRGTTIARAVVLVMMWALAACGPSSSTPDASGDDAGANQQPDGGMDASSPDGGMTSGRCANGCLVGSVCYPDGVTDPADPCQVCDVSRAADAFSPNAGARCDDGLFCTVMDTCGGDGSCAGTARSCDDGIACNGEATCDEASSACQAGTTTCTGGQVCDAVSGDCVMGCSGCLIDGVCYGDGQVDPLDPCQVCDVSASRDTWSANDGASCDDGLFCTTGDVCSGGTCTGGAARECDDGVACNGAESCDESGGACVSGASTCASGEICDVASDACIAVCTGCVIGGSCFGIGQRNPDNDCEVCDPSTSAADWTPNDGARCDDGLFCTEGDTCSGTTCGGSARSCADGIACNGDETCDESAGACAAGTPTCTGGTLCDLATDACVTTCSGCVIGGTCYGDGQVDPSNPCRVCDASASATSWSPNDGARCDDGLFCTEGDTCSGTTCGGSARSCDDGVACNGAETCDEAGNTCTAGATTCAANQVCDVLADSCVARCGGCVIGGVCYADGTRDPSNACQICDVARSASAWSTNDGASCDDALFCTRGDVCSGGVCAGTSTDFCGDGVACDGVETCNEATDSCAAGATTCASGQVCDVSADACVTACTGCVIGGVCYANGSARPDQRLPGVRLRERAERVDRERRRALRRRALLHRVRHLLRERELRRRVARLQ